MSGLQRKEPLRRTGGLGRGKPLERSAGLARGSKRLGSRSKTNSGNGVRRTTEPMPDGRRDEILARAGGRCELEGLGHERCGGRADDVHHRYPKEYGGSHEPANLMALCSWHNRHWAETFRDEAAELGVRFRSWQDEPSVPFDRLAIHTVTR